MTNTKKVRVAMRQCPVSGVSVSDRRVSLDRVGGYSCNVCRQYVRITKDGHVRKH